MAKRDARSRIRRIIDANYNRALEGLRVCEEITRFILDDGKLTARLKRNRHLICAAMVSRQDRRKLLASRSTGTDVGKKITLGLETKRGNYRDIFFANLQRVKESIRVLEEFSKLTDVEMAMRFKKIRYSVYEIEKSVAAKIRSLRNIG
ncbi:MAG: thiamine-phosphate pyrophosphorylase [Candidatus Omnitrophica bacterium]|nr:thiamine-phosphate pyrophosphorylase [Candidatus Omnitrophota bacterium]